MKPYELYYWPSIPGRGEFVRLALEQAGVDYIDVARRPEAEGGGVPAIARVLEGEKGGTRPFAPPILVADECVISQTTAILHFIGQRHDLVSKDGAHAFATLQVQLTIADFVSEVHDTHHPTTPMAVYEMQKPEAAKKAAAFREYRLPKFLRYFEAVLQESPSVSGQKHLVGSALTYADLSLFHVLEGLEYAFPRAFEKLTPSVPRLIALRAYVESLPRIAAYLKSDRRLRFNESDIFRHYPELDGT